MTVGVESTATPLKAIPITEPNLEPTLFAAVFITMIAAGCVKGIIGLGRVAKEGTALAIHFICKS